MVRRFITPVVAVAGLLVAACAEAPSGVRLPTTDASLGKIPAGPGPNVGTANIEFFEVCKQYVGQAGPAVTIDVAVTGVSAPTNFQVSLANGECKDVWLHGGAADVVTVTEQVPAGYTASYVREIATRTSYTIDPVVAGNSASGNVSGTPGEGVIVKFINTYIPPTGQLGNFVWIDSNGNGVQDSGEPGIPNVSLTLSGAVSGTTTTDANGLYLFTGLPAGSYTVTVTGGIPAGYTPTTSFVGSPTFDSNGSPASATLPTNSSSDLTIDFGYVAPPPPPPPSYCTLTQGYWKNHTEDWDNVSDNRPFLSTDIFYNSATSYITIMQTPPSKGNAYLQLAHQFIAARLNVGGAPSGVAAVDAALSGAAAYFGSAPAGIPEPTGALRTQLQGWATTLDNFNNGLIGPGHCS